MDERALQRDGEQTTMNPPQSKKIYIVNGYQASPNDHWYPWLSQKLQQAGHVAKRVVLAQAQQPDFDSWQKFLAVQMPEIDQNTIIISHQLASVSVLHYLTQYFERTGATIRAGIFIAGFKDSLPAQPQLQAFIQKAQYKQNVLQTHMPLVIQFVSPNDPLVPPPEALKLGHYLNAQMHEVPNAGNFRKQDGFAEFPALWQVLQPLL